ncbi:NAD-dependent epimerase/dehydratase family protein [Williamsia sp.]|uniref:NAD-dependent epimerase/dehydratase family protein n=1 Tax=Williamsia sp. TaxID=1872085 RepID=UPI001A224655|nr:NAD-dependent epimerase/dehydratase family protein [Williamsia sp.]MBJ7291613.1 NAD-dependent epimerase/dehydratase family protein [Williamsia sp.]
MSPDIDTSTPVLVTGATGYVAGWLIKELLTAGVTVHGTVRDPDNTAKVAHLTALADASPGTLRLFRAQLLEDGSFDEAMAGCGIVFHTASPFTSDFDDAQRDLVDPAVEGTRTVLESADRTESVTRVVLTSSVAAIYTDTVDCADAGGTLTEENWNTSASLDYEPYNLSKTLAEKKAWEIADAQSRWRLVVINPSLVIGPALGPAPTSESFAIVSQLGNGMMALGAPRIKIGVVDVREVATAHVNAAYLPDAEGRHILSAANTDLLEMGRALLPRFGWRRPLPRFPLPIPVLVAVAPLVGRDRRFVKRCSGRPLRLDNSKSRSALGISYRPMQESLEQMFATMLDAGQVKLLR